MSHENLEGYVDKYGPPPIRALEDKRRKGFCQDEQIPAGPSHKTNHGILRKIAQSWQRVSFPIKWMDGQPKESSFFATKIIYPRRSRSPANGNLRDVFSVLPQRPNQHPPPPPPRFVPNNPTKHHGFLSPVPGHVHCGIQKIDQLQVCLREHW